MCPGPACRTSPPSRDSVWCLLAACASPPPAVIPPKPPVTPPLSAAVTDALSMERVRADVDLLAADERGGRIPGSPGHAFVADTLQAEIALAGLEPVGDSLRVEFPLSLGGSWRGLDAAGAVYDVPAQVTGANLLGVRWGTERPGRGDLGRPHRPSHLAGLHAAGRLRERPITNALHRGGAARSRARRRVEGIAGYPENSRTQPSGVQRIRMQRLLLDDPLGPERSPELAAAIDAIAPRAQRQARRQAGAAIRAAAAAVDQDVGPGPSRSLTSPWTMR